MSKHRRTKRYADQPHVAAHRRMKPGDLERGAFYVQEVRHDDWCDLLSGRGYCNCSPDIRLVKQGEGPRR